MAENVSDDVIAYRVTGDWRHVVEDGMVDEDALPDEVLPTGHVEFVPLTSGPVSGGFPATAYTLAPYKALIADGELHDLQGRAGVWLAGEVGGVTIRWRARVHLEFRGKVIDYPDVEFDLTDDVRLTGLISNGEAGQPPIIVDPRIEAIAARLDEADQIVSTVAGYAQDAQAQVPLAKAEADRAIGLANAQDEHIAGTLEDPTSATHAAFKAVGNATYGRAVVPKATVVTKRLLGDAEPRAIGYFGGTVYGQSSGTLYTSDASMESWTALGSVPNIGTLVKIMPCQEHGAAVVFGAEGVARVTGLGGTLTSSKKFGVNGNARIVAFCTAGHTATGRFGAVEYGPGGGSFADSRYGWISTDDGHTFARVWDSDANTANAPAESHVHTIAYDPVESLWYLSEGHGPEGGIYTSADDGATWVYRPNLYISPGPTVMVATVDGIVVGSDAEPSGALGIHRVGPLEHRTLRQVAPWRSGFWDGVIGFPKDYDTDPDTGVVFMVYQSSHMEDRPIITASTATGGQVIWTWDGVAPTETTPQINGCVLVGNRLRAYAIVAEQRWVIDLWVSTTPSPLTDDPGNIRGGMAIKNSSVAVGPDTSTLRSDGAWSIRSVAIGSGSTVGGHDSVAIGGLSSATGTGSAVVGTMSTVPAYTVAMGANITVQGHSSVVLGQGATNGPNATQSVIIGRAAGATGARGVSVGADAQANALHSTAIGYQASIPSAVMQRSVAFQGATASRADQFHIGARHIAQTVLTSEPASALTGEAFLYLYDNAGVMELRAKKGGTVHTVWSEAGTVEAGTVE